MSVEHRSRTGKTYYLHVKSTSAGRFNYFFSTDADGPLAPAIPDGYEVYENVDGQVFLRKKTIQAILPLELVLVEDALSRHGKPWQYRAEIKKNTIVVYSANDMTELDKLTVEFRGRPLSDGEKQLHARYMAVLRFVLTDPKKREFRTDRFCFKGSIDDWIPVSGAGTLINHVRSFVKHLGRESFYELM